MATINLNQATEVVHQAAAQLAELEWLDQEAAQQLGPLAEAVANMFMIVFYQASTGQASQADFAEALATVRQRLMH